MNVTVLEGADFAEIEAHAAGQRLDLAIGNSKGYGLSRKLQIPLVRVGFPIHDRVDGPRLLHVGYRGAQQLFDRIVNAVIARCPGRIARRLQLYVTARDLLMALDTLRHPCFNDAARHRFARIHLPVAPDCNIQCNFCKRVYDCANESRPGVTTAVLSPSRPSAIWRPCCEKDPRIAVVGIAGPGDPFATPERTLETLRLVRERHPEMLLCVASNGLAVAPYVDELAALEVSHVTLTVNAVDPEIGAKIYAWVRDRKRVYRGQVGAQLLWDRQAEAIRALKDRGITVKINTIIVPGVNDQHVVEIARQVAELGADIANCVPLYPVAGTEFAAVPPPRARRVAADPRGGRPASAHHGTLHPLPGRRGRTAGRADAAGDRNVPAAIGRHALQSRGRSALCGRGHPGRRAGQSTPRRSGTDRRVWPERERFPSGRNRRRTPPPGGGTNVGRPWPKRSRTAGRCWSPAPARRPVRRSPTKESRSS